MQHSRSRRGNSFQERDSEGRFTSSDSRRGRYNGGYNGGGYGDYDNNRGNGGRSQYENQGDYGYEDGYDDYPQGRSRGWEDDDYRNENEDRYQGRYNDYEERERGYNDRDYGDRNYGDYNRNYDQRQSSYRQGDYDDRNGGYDDYGHREGWNGGGRQDWQYDRSNHRSDREGNGNSRRGSNHRGFETMSRSEVRRIAAMGGRASHGGSSQSGRSRSGRGGRVSNRRRSRSSR